MKTRRGRLIAVDGVDGRAFAEAAGKIAARSGAVKGVSRWDASGLFEQMLVAGDVAAASPRLLLLLYAADLAFRLRWEIEPALAEGRAVAAAPYVDTAVAFGRACGLELKWLTQLFRFARTPSERHVVNAPAGASRNSAGFIAYGCSQLLPRRRQLTRTRLHREIGERLRRRPARRR